MVSSSSEVVKELTAIKKLLVLALANSGMTQSQIAAALEIDRTGVGRMFPKGTLTNLKGKGEKGAGG
jgi:DNA-binding transcriptional regulator LsrR (DeoR family)